MSIHLEGKQVIAPVGEQGWLTPVRATFGDKSMWIFTCRCGESVTRKAKDVRQRTKRGEFQACLACVKKRKLEQKAAAQ